MVLSAADADGAMPIAGTLPRPAVARRFRLAARRRIVVVHAAPGSGKSVAIAQHLATVPGRHATFAVRYEHADVAPFARGLAEAVSPLAPAIVRTLPAAFTNVRRQAEPWDAVARWFAEQLTHPMTIVIDELHRIDDDAPACRFLTRAIDASGPHVRWILATHSTAALPLPRWLATGAADASVDDAVLRVATDDAPQLGAALHAPTAAWRIFAAHADLLVALLTLPRLDDDVLAALPPDALLLIDRIAAVIPQAFVDGARAFSESARTRAFAMIARHAPAAIDRGRMIAAQTLEAAGRLGPALQLYTTAGATEPCVRILKRDGFELYESGSADIVAAAIAALPEAERRTSAIALTLEATNESFRGRYDVSESWFEHALRLASDERQRLHVDIAFAVELLRRGRPDALERLEALAPLVSDGPSAVIVPASLATAYASAGRIADAQTQLARALAALPGISDTTVHAMAHQRAAFVALAAGDTSEAAAHAERAASLAHECGNDELRAVARSVTYVIAYSYEDDQARALAALEEIGRAGERLGNAFFRRFALIGSYMLHAERFDDTAVTQLDRRLEREELEASMQHVDEGLMPARALAATWSGDFGSAHAALAASAPRQPTPEARALRWAETAAYAAIAGRDDEAGTALANAGEALAEIGDDETVDRVRAGLLLALAALALQRPADADAMLAELVPRIQRWPRWSPVAAFLSAVSAGEPEMLLALLDEMHAAGIGGWARMLENVPAHLVAAAAIER